jgi:hypothetical protein
MRWPRIIFLSLILLLLGAFLHYTLPQRDVVRITGTQLQLTEISGWSGLFYAQSDSGAEGTSVQRDVRIISAVRPDNTPIDYRNEDTGLFGWPPYFKIDSQDVQTEAQDLRSTRDDPVWVAITHYGWRSNCSRPTPMRCPSERVDGPDVSCSLGQHRDPAGSGACDLHGLADLGAVRGPGDRALRRRVWPCAGPR